MNLTIENIIMLNHNFIKDIFEILFNISIILHLSISLISVIFIIKLSNDYQVEN